MEGIVDTGPVLVVEDPEITSNAIVGPEQTRLMAFDDDRKGDSSATSCPWSLTHKQQVQNLKENWKKAFNLNKKMITSGNKFKTTPWFARVVSHLRVDPCLDSCNGLEIDESLLIRLKSRLRMTSLGAAILMGDLKMVQKILERNFVQDNLIFQLLMDPKRASMSFRLVLSDTIMTTNFLYTPLHLAVASGDSYIVDVLLEKGVDVNAQNSLGQTPLDLACKLGNVPMLQQLLQKDVEGKDILHVAMQHGDINFMEKLSFVIVNAVDRNGKTPLHYLATRRFPSFQVSEATSIVQYLGQNDKLDLKALDYKGFSAFYVAVLCCNTELVIALLDSFKDRIRLNEECDKS